MKTTPKNAKEILYREWQGFLEDNLDYGGVSDAYKLAFKALDQMNAIENIKAEIKDCIVESYHACSVDADYRRGLSDALDIINKHMS